MSSAASRTSHKSARASRCINDFASAIDALPKIRVLDRAGFHQVNGPPQSQRQAGLQVKKRFERTYAAALFELDKKISVAMFDIKICAPRCGAKDFKPPNIKPHA